MIEPGLMDRVPLTHRKLSRVDSLAQIGGLVRNIEGAMVECGVMRGHSAGILAINSFWEQHRHVWLLDSFEGLPEPTAEDGENAAAGWAKRGANWCLCDETHVLAVFRCLRWPEEKLHLVKGWLADTLPTLETGPIALLHLDVDWYEATRLCLARLWPRVVLGGILAVDDYRHWPGCRQAVDEALARGDIWGEVGADPGYWYVMKREKQS